MDQYYNGWFSASVSTSLVPGTYSPSGQDIYNVAKAFKIVYIRRSTPSIADTPPKGSCNWQTANQRMHLHFDPSRQNVDFYFVGDEVSRKVTAQWDGLAANKTDIGLIYASIYNVAQEIRCLHPAPDYLYLMVVDSNGSIIWMARLPATGIQSLDLNQIEFVY